MQCQRPTSNSRCNGVYPPHPETFVIQLIDEGITAHARQILSGVERKQVHVSGMVVKAPAPYNVPWNFYLSPESIAFFELAVEVCDASIRYVAEHLDEVGGAFLPDSRWCPWDHALCANCQRLKAELPLLYALCPLCVLPCSTPFDFPSFFNVYEEPFVRASFLLSYCRSCMFVPLAATSVS